jgi:hypothetical protein
MANKQCGTCGGDFKVCDHGLIAAQRADNLRLVVDMDTAQQRIAELAEALEYALEELDSWHTQFDSGPHRVGWVLRMEESYQRTKARGATALQGEGGMMREAQRE